MASLDRVQIRKNFIFLITGSSPSPPGHTVSSHNLNMWCCLWPPPTGKFFRVGKGTCNYSKLPSRTANFPFLIGTRAGFWASRCNKIGCKKFSKKIRKTFKKKIQKNFRKFSAANPLENFPKKLPQIGRHQINIQLRSAWVT